MPVSPLRSCLICSFACFRPTPISGGNLSNGTLFEPLRWSFERIHFDHRPVDIAIVGDLKTLLGLSAERVEERLRL